MSEQRAELKLAVMASLGHGCPVLALVGRIAAPILRIMDDDWAARTPPAAVPPACSSPSLAHQSTNPSLESRSPSPSRSRSRSPAVAQDFEAEEEAGQEGQAEQARCPVDQVPDQQRHPLQRQEASLAPHQDWRVRGQMSLL